MKPDLAPLEFNLTAAEKSEVAVFQCQIDRQRRDRNALDRAMEEKRQRPMREQWQRNFEGRP